MHKNPLPMTLVMIAALTWLVTVATAQQDVGKGASQAKEVAEQFMMAMKAEDIDAVMAVVDVPFFLDGKSNVKERDELKVVFIEVFEQKDLGQTG